MEALISIKEALARILPKCQYKKIEVSDLFNAFGKTLAKDIEAVHDVPAFDRAMLDGYAVNYEDICAVSVEHPVLLNVVERVPAGFIPTRELVRGEAFRTMTGAPIAEGADTLVQFEFTEFMDDGEIKMVKILRAVPMGEAVQRKGKDIRMGQRLLRAGMQIGSKEIALLATQGISEVTVLSPPKVGIYSTGSEVVDLNEPLQAGQVYNSNTPMLSALVRSVGAMPYPGKVLKDEPEVIRKELTYALDTYDVIVTTGGVSVGDFDLIPGIMEELGVNRLFWGVYMRPGTPIYVGTYEGKLVFALSGNPSAAFINAHVLLVPALSYLLGKIEQEIRAFPARLYRAPQKKKIKHTRFLSGRLFLQDHEWWIDVGGEQSVGSLTRFANTNALARIEPGEDIQEGRYVQVELLPV
jgi:molybdopterin molybdotransferase